jgi:hypothetical protein
MNVLQGMQWIISFSIPEPHRNIYSPYIITSARLSRAAGFRAVRLANTEGRAGTGGLTKDPVGLSGCQPVRLLDTLLKSRHSMVEGRLYPAMSWIGMLYRVRCLSVWEVSIGFNFATLLHGIACAHPHELSSGANFHFSLSALLRIVMYLTLFLGMILIFGTCTLTGCTSSTTIPCINSLWYMIYTLVLILLALASFVVGMLETRIIRCGKHCGEYTTYPPDLDSCT